MSSTYCKFGFNSVHWDSNGRTAPCCTFRGPDDLKNLSATEYWNSPWLADVQKKMLNGEKVAGCNRCYEEERLSGTSMRNTDKVRYSKSPILKRMHITYSNKCNKTCNICRPYRSHLIGKEYQKIIKNDPNNAWMKDKIIQQPYTKASLGNIKFEGLTDERLEDIASHIHNLESIYVDGGEVFIDKEYFVKILDIIKKANRQQDIKLTITTNGSYTEDDLKMLEDHRVKFLMSADGIHNLYELVRSPHNWDWFTNKMQMLEKYPQHRVQIETVMHCFNVHQLPDIVQYWKYPVNLTMLFHQEYLGAHICPNSVLEESANKLQALGRKNNAQYLRSCMKKNVPKDKVLFHEFIKTMEPIKKLNYQSYIPWSFDLVK